MLTPLRRRLSYANVTATIALLFSMTGGALAAGHYLVSSTKQISPKVLKQLKGAAGKTGAAGPAGAAGAHGLTGAAGEKGLQGQRGVEGGPAVHWNASAAGKEDVVLATVGPFTITGRCNIVGGEAKAQTFIASSEAGSWAEIAEGTAPTKLKAGELFPVGEEAGSEATPGEFLAPEGPFSAVSANGAASLDGMAADGAFVNGETGPPCRFTGYTIGTP